MSGAPDWLARLAALALALSLVVAAASAYIRLGTGARDCEKGLRCAGGPAAAAAPGIAVARGTQRVSASLSALAIIGLAALALRRGQAVAPALGAFAVAAVLTAIGLIYGISPPPNAALANLFGGVALVMLLAWLLGRLKDRGARSRGVLVAAALLLAQSAFGAWLSTRAEAPQLGVAAAHGVLGLAAAAAAVVAGLRLADRGLCRLGVGLAALALAAYAAGLATLAFDAPLSAGVAHNFAASFLAAALGYAAARST